MIPESIKKKLNPQRFPRMSPKMTAIVCYLLEMEPQTEPHIIDMCCTSDGFVLAARNDDHMHNALIGTYPDLLRNWSDLIHTPGVDLTPDELTLCKGLLKEHITMYQPPVEETHAV